MDEKPHTDIEEHHSLEATTADASTSGDFNFDNLSASEHATLRRELLKSIDFRLVPILAAIYFVSFLDKNALSQAKLSGLEDDLGLHGTQFNTATSIYFVGYIVFQPASNMLLTRIRPSIYLACAVTIWGIVAGAQASVESYTGLILIRLFLGVAESPTFPACVFMLSSWYTRKELAHRFAWFFAGQQLANAFGGLIAAGILAGLDGACGWHAWRWLFLVEGLITLVVAMVTILFLPDYPSTSMRTGTSSTNRLSAIFQKQWLTPRQSAYANYRLHKDTAIPDKPGSLTPWQGFLLMIRDPMVPFFLLLQHSGNLVQTFIYFFPAIVKTLGYSNINTLLITAPIWFATFMVSLGATYTAGKYGSRVYHIVGLLVISIIGNIMMISSTVTAVRFVAMFLLAIGGSSAFQIIVSFVASTFPRPFEKRAQLVAWGSFFGNSASVYGAYMYPNSSAPRFIAGGAAVAAIGVWVICLSLGLRWWLVKMNRKLDQKERREARAEKTAVARVEDVEAVAEEKATVMKGTEVPRGFRYVL